MFGLIFSDTGIGELAGKLRITRGGRGMELVRYLGGPDYLFKKLGTISILIFKFCEERKKAG